MIRVLSAAPRDLAGLGALAVAAGYPAYDSPALVAALDRGAILLTVEGGGALVLAEVVVDEAELHLILVEPDARRAGLGRSLLVAVAERAKDKGAARMFLEVAAANAAAIALYRSAGFTETGRRRAYYPDGQDAVLFALTLG